MFFCNINRNLKSVLWAFFIISVPVVLDTVSALTPLETTAKQAVIIDFANGAILYEKNAKILMNPSSMTKILTAYLVFERLKDRRLSLMDEFTVSSRAQSMEGTRMFVQSGTRVSLKDLLRGIIVQSGNDACTVVAEAIAGSEALFAKEMTKVAHGLGATQTNFANASGLPAPDHLTTAYDLAVIASRVIKDFPDYYHMFSEKEFTYNRISQMNRNILLGRCPGVDGLKTGSSNIAGHGMIASAIRQGRRVIVVANGFSSDSERATEVEKMIDWAFREFETITFAKAGLPLAEIEIWGGAKPSVAVTSLDDIMLTVPKTLSTMPQATIVYTSPLLAPISEGMSIAKLRVPDGTGGAYREYPLVSLESVNLASFWQKIVMTLDYLLWGKKQTNAILNSQVNNAQ